MIKMNIELITAKVYIKNQASIKLLENFGLEKEGELDKSFRYPGRNAESMYCYFLDLNKIKIKKILNKQVQVIIDRPLGSKHRKYPDIVNSINYGYIKDIYSGDGEEQDAYILGVNEPIKIYNDEIIAILHRLNDVEDKWIVLDESDNYIKDEIEKIIDFKEKYFEHELFL